MTWRLGLLRTRRTLIPAPPTVEWELNVDPVTLKEFIRKDFVGPSPYPYILPSTTKLTPPPTANPFRPVAVSCVLIHTRITVGGTGLKRSSVEDTPNANGSAAKSTGFLQVPCGGEMGNKDWALVPQLDRLKNDPRSQGTSDAPRNTSPYYARCGLRSHTCTFGSCTCIYSSHTS